MIKNKTKRIEKTLFSSTILILLLLIHLSINTSALNLDAPNTVFAQQNEQALFKIEIINNTSKIILFEKNVSIGTITQKNNSYEFNWITNYPLTGFVDILFTAEDNETKTTKKVTVAKPPQIYNYSDKYTNENKIDFTLNTDINSVCKYDLSEKSYNNLAYTLQRNTNGTKHSGTTPTLTQGLKTIFIVCESNKGAKTSTSFNIEVELYPTAEIRLKPPSPLRAGIIAIEVVTSEDLLFEPELKYYFDDDTNPKSITLTGSGNRWSGYMVIQESDKRRIGTFMFKGVDKTNLEGTEITSGKIFIVDNSNPSKLSSIEGQILQDKIRLDWRYLDDDIDAISEYRIYRKTSSGGVTYVDYLTSTTKTHYDDYNIEYGKAYYYKVSAVNHAGKEGELSREIALTFIPERTEDITEKKGLDPVLITDLNKVIATIENLIFDIELAETNIRNLEDEKETTIIQELNLLSNFVAAKNKLNNIKLELESLADRDLSQSEFDKITNDLLKEANKAINEAPNKIEITDSKNYQEPFNEEITREALTKYLLHENFNMSLKETKTFLEELIQIQQNTVTEVLLIKANIEYKNKTEEISLIQKEILSNEDETDIIILDKISINNFDEIIFSERPEIIDQNLAKWDTRKLPKKIIYYTLHDLSMENLENTRTFLIKETEIEAKKNLITGLITQPSGEGLRHPLLVPLIIGILSVTFLSIYYFKSEELTIPKNISLKNAFKSISRKKDDSHRRLDLEKPPELFHTDIESPFHNDNYEKTEKKEFEKNLTETENTNLDVISKKEEEIISDKGAISTEDKDAKEVLQDLKEIMYSEEGVDSDFKYLLKAKKMNKSLLKPAPVGKEFFLCDGRKIKNLKELEHTLYFMSEEVFKHHVNDNKNDFYTWTKDVFGFKTLAFKLKRAKTRKEIIRNFKI